MRNLMEWAINQTTTTTTKKFTEKLTELKDRSRRNNLWYDEFLEQDDVASWEDKEDWLKKFIAEGLRIEEEVIIERDHERLRKWCTE